MNEFVKRHAAVIEASAAALTAIVAVLALFGVLYQVRAAATIQAQQSARDAYRNHLALAVTVPDLAEPSDACGIIAGEKAAAYDAFVAHLLYAAEQMLEVDPDWREVFRREIAPHQTYVCSYQGQFLSDGVLDDILAEMAAQCPKTPICPNL